VVSRLWQPILPPDHPMSSSSSERWQTGSRACRRAIL